jgi:hypothetical protein
VLSRINAQAIDRGKLDGARTASQNGEGIADGGDEIVNQRDIEGSIQTQAIILLLFHLLWPAKRAALEAMDQSFPPRPVLFIRLMLILKPSGFRQLFSNLWVTHPHTATPYHP